MRGGSSEKIRAVGTPNDRSHKIAMHTMWRELMNERTVLLELLLAGFFAVACIKSWGPAAPAGKINFGDLLRFPDRLERLRRSRWQWFSMVLLILVLRLENQLPLVLEITVLLEFLTFTALPALNTSEKAGRRPGNAALVGRR